MPTVRLLPLASLAVVFFQLSGCGKPKYPACNGDKDCRAGEKCVNKKCVKCASDKDCGPGKQCVNGACRLKPGACDDNSDCPRGQMCKDNACVKAPNACATDNDCPEDEDCVEGLCTKGGGAGAPPKCQLEPIYFGFDQYTITDEAKGVLQKDYECLTLEAKRKVVLVGYTDPRGTTEYNIGLSDDRAQAVASYLSRLGIDAGRLRKLPKGASEAKGTDEAGWAKDRRVDFQWE